MVGYDVLLADVMGVIEDAQRAAARSVNAVMTATYWFIARRLVEHEQRGAERAEDGKEPVEHLPPRTASPSKSSSAWGPEP